MSAVPAEAWLAMLESSCEKLGSHCLDIIIDQSGSARPWLPSVQSVEPPLPWYSLFTGLPEAGALHLAPMLVRVDLRQPLQRHWLTGLMEELADRSQLLLLVSQWRFEALAEHLMRCVEVQQNGVVSLLRYYNPRIFPVLFSHVLDPAQKSNWLHPVLFWSWLDRDGVPQHLAGTAGVPDASNKFERLLLSPPQVAALCCIQDAAELMQALSDMHPETWGAERRFQYCYTVALDAYRKGALAADPFKAEGCCEGGAA